MGSQSSRFELFSWQQDKQTEYLRLTFHKLKSLFLSEIAVLALQGFIIGFYVASFLSLFQRNLEQEKQVGPECPLCYKAPFQAVCGECGKVLACGDCLNTLKECPRCCQQLNQSVIRVYMA